MSFWNYRVILHKAGCLEHNPELRWEEYLAIHEVHYNDDGNPELVTEDSVRITGDEGNSSLDAIKFILEKASEAIEKPILNYDNLTEINKEKQDEFSTSFKEKKQTSTEDFKASTRNSKRK